MSIRRENKAQDLCNELFLLIEGDMSDAWISDDAGTNDPQEFLGHAYGSLLALEDARKKIKGFLKKHKFRPRSSAV